MDLSKLSPIQHALVQGVDEGRPRLTETVARQFGVTRQAVSGHLRRLVADSILSASGRTKARAYSLNTLADEAFAVAVGPSLEEDVVFRDRVSPLLRGLPRNVLDICSYGFTEILNNAKEHSGATTAAIHVDLTAVRVTLIIHDPGIGIFHKIMGAAGLESEREAILELSKGKFTTDPTRHTGEGIFFTSRMFDVFRLSSHDLSVFHVRDGEDWLVEDTKHRYDGTTVSLSLDPLSPHTDIEVFGSYASAQDDYAFAKTQVLVHLARSGDEKLVSRSQAKRIAARLDRFKVAILDFTGIDSVGPAFADELFRVFANAHPGVRLEIVNASPEVDRMVRRARAAS